MSGETGQLPTETSRAALGTARYGHRGLAVVCMNQYGNNLPTIRRVKHEHRATTDFPGRALLPFLTGKRNLEPADNRILVFHSHERVHAACTLVARKRPFGRRSGAGILKKHGQVRQVHVAAKFDLCLSACSLLDHALKHLLGCVTGQLPSALHAACVDDDNKAENERQYQATQSVYCCSQQTFSA